MSQVIHIKTAPDNWRDNPEYVYIGYASPRYNIKRSKWNNHLRIRRDSDRASILQAYRVWLMRQDDLLADLHELRGKTLVCYCAPEACHGDVLAELANAAETVGQVGL